MPRCVHLVEVAEVAHNLPRLTAWSAQFLEAAAEDDREARILLPARLEAYILQSLVLAVEDGREAQLPLRAHLADLALTVLVNV